MSLITVIDLQLTFLQSDFGMSHC